VTPGVSTGPTGAVVTGPTGAVVAAIQLGRDLVALHAVCCSVPPRADGRRSLMTPLARLPIDDVLPEVVRAVAADGAVVIEAPPGAGKTTRVPRALLDAARDAPGDIWVLEPRRLPARLAAARVAAELGQQVGDEIGYAVRFDEAIGPRTRVQFLTEGLFLRRMLAAPALPGVAAVILDELHERHVATDLALAWVRHLRATSRPDLAVLAMSATLDAEPVRAFLDGALVRSEGRTFEVAVEHLPNPDDRPMDRQVAGAVRRLLREEPDGDLLVFLPGAGEIRRAQTALAELPGAGELLILPLHGDLPLEEQTRAVRPAGRRKIVLATNVAESSVTIDGVVGVIDAGLARIATHSPWTGLPTLALGKISQAAAIQRAGRAGRTRPGRALRLYTRHDFDQRRAHDEPEIARSDLAELALALATLGVADADALSWLEAPPAAAWGVARELLARLGAIERSGGRAGALTEVGRRMARLPVHPRLARLVVEGETRGVGDAACLAAALISERDIRTSARASFATAERAGLERGAEVIDLVDLFREAERARFGADVVRRLELDRRALDDVARVRRQLAAGLARRNDAPRPNDSTALRQAVLAAFPDRVARRRGDERRTVVLAAGGSASLGFEPSHDWLVAVDVEERKRGTRTSGVEVRLGSTIEPEWLLDLFPENVEEVDTRAFNPTTARVERTSGLRYGALVLDETITPAPADEETARLLAAAAVDRGLDRLPGGEALPELLQRLVFARTAVPDAPLPALDAAGVAELVRVACQGQVGFSGLTDLRTLVLAALPGESRRALETLAPERITLGGGRTVAVHYSADAPPWIESRLQDFFGTRSVPAIAGGRVPLTVHLLAPNGRAVQVTRDIAGFWTQHYPALRRELGRRYPRHAWPEDGATARPPPPLPPRRR
jgi:ATP-dependent helicase HrpB